MGTMTTGSVHEYVRLNLADFPSGDSGTNLTMMIDLSRIRIQQYTGDSITSPFDDKYYPAMVSITMMLQMAKQAGVGIDYNASIGEFSVGKGGVSSNPELETYATMASESLHDLGKKMHFSKVFG